MSFASSSVAASREEVRSHVLAAIIVCYGTLVIGSNFVASVIPQMKMDPELNFTNSDAGVLLACGSAGSMLGKMVNGVLSKSKR